MKAGVEELGKITYQAHNWSILKRMNLHHSWLPTFPDVYHSLPSKIGLMLPVFTTQALATSTGLEIRSLVKAIELSGVKPKQLHFSLVLLLCPHEA